MAGENYNETGDLRAIRGAVETLVAAGSGGDASAANQVTIIGHVDGIETALTTLLGYVDGLEGFTDGVETLITSTNTLLTTQAGYVDGLETLLTTQAGYLDGVETKLDTVHTDLSYIAHDAVDSGNPNKLGGYAKNTAPTAVSADGDRVNAWFGLNGQQATMITRPDGGAIAAVANNGDGANANNGLVVWPHLQAYNGSTWDRVRGDLYGLVTQLAQTANRWQYAAAASGISNTTTAVTFKAAAGASIVNYITSVQIMWEALGTATELAVRDGAGGTVIWRTKIPASLAGTREIVFPVPLKGTANTLLEVVTLTASTTGAVYFNAQGYVAA